jgi:hypothetical protein
MSSSTERPETPGRALDFRDGAVAGQEPEPDPWFEPANGLTAADAAGSEADQPGAGPDQPADGETELPADQWFLRTGRAGLLPESMTEEEPEPGTGSLPRIVVPSDGAPPWAAEPAVTDDGRPPPWESGPWGAEGSGGSGSRAADSRAAAAAAGNAAASPGLQLPGGLRLSGRASWIVAGALTAVAVIVILVVTLGGGSSADPGCTAWQSAGRASYAAVQADLASHAPASALAAKLRVAIRQVNLAAAQAHQASVQADLAALTSDLQTALADVTRTPMPAQVLQGMRRDAAAAAAACKS